MAFRRMNATHITQLKNAEMPHLPFAYAAVGTPL